MPKIYLSPSTQEGNMYVTGKSEEYHMNKLADYLEPYLYSMGISFARNNPEQSVVSIQNQSNQGNYDMHLALHSNAAPEGKYGTIQGVDIYHFAASGNGARGAQLIKDEFKKIYPYPDKVRTLTTTSLGEVDRVKAPSVFLEIGYHDNLEDATWVENNYDQIARAIAKGLGEYFAIPFVEPIEPKNARVKTSGANLNIRSRPNEYAAIKGRIPNGAQVKVYGLLPNWAAVKYNNILGFVNRNYLSGL